MEEAKPSPEEQVKEEAPKKSKTWLVILLLVVIVAVAVGIYFFAFYKPAPDAEAPPSLEPEEQVSLFQGFIKKQVPIAEEMFGFDVADFIGFTEEDVALFDEMVAGLEEGVTPTALPFVAPNEEEPYNNGQHYLYSEKILTYDQIIRNMNPEARAVVVAMWEPKEKKWVLSQNDFYPQLFETKGYEPENYMRVVPIDDLGDVIVPAYRTFIVQTLGSTEIYDANVSTDAPVGKFPVCEHKDSESWVNFAFPAGAGSLKGLLNECWDDVASVYVQSNYNPVAFADENRIYHFKYQTDEAAINNYDPDFFLAWVRFKTEEEKAAPVEPPAEVCDDEVDNDEDGDVDCDDADCAEAENCVVEEPVECEEFMVANEEGECVCMEGREYNFDINQCVCSGGMTDPDGDGVCTCPPGTEFNEEFGGCRAVTECADYVTSPTCIVAPEGCHWDDATSTCLEGAELFGCAALITDPTCEADPNCDWDFETNVCEPAEVEEVVVTGCASYNSSPMCIVAPEGCHWDEATSTCLEGAELFGCAALITDPTCEADPNCDWNFETNVCEEGMGMEAGNGCADLITMPTCDADPNCKWNIDTGVCEQDMGMEAERCAGFITDATCNTEPGCEWNFEISKCEEL